MTNIINFLQVLKDEVCFFLTIVQRKLIFEDYVNYLFLMNQNFQSVLEF